MAESLGRPAPNDRADRGIASDRHLAEAKLDAPFTRRDAGAKRPRPRVDSALVQSVLAQAEEGDRDAMSIVAYWLSCGHEESWAWVIRQSEREAAAILRRTTGRRDAQLAEDLAQSAATDVYTMFMRARFDASRGSSLRGLLRVIISRTLAKLLVREARDARRGGEYLTRSLGAASEEFAEHPGLSEPDRATVHRVIARLGEPERTAVILHARGLTLEQIGEQIGFRSKSGTRRVLMRALTRAVEMIGREESGEDPGASGREGAADERAP
jgi:RNA polymerase sigma factor (sigma-70 family)